MRDERSGARFLRGLLLLAGVLLVAYGTASETVHDATPPPTVPAANSSPSPGPSSDGLDVTRVDGGERREQIARVVRAMDESGRPPDGVAQGGRRGETRGVFMNAEGLLPRKPRGYWIESDVWAHRRPRGPERLVFGREREVYYTADHYASFVRIR